MNSGKVTNQMAILNIIQYILNTLVFHYVDTYTMRSYTPGKVIEMNKYLSCTSIRQSEAQSTEKCLNQSTTTIKVHK